MSQNSAESINFKIYTKGGEKTIPQQYRQLTLEQLLNWIDKQNLSDKEKEDMKKIASKYPQQTLSSFKKNFRQHVSSYRKRNNL